MDKSALLSAASTKLRAAIRRDRENRYALKQAWELPPVRCRAVGVEPFAYSGEHVLCLPDADGIRLRIVVRPYTAESGVCDGCSLAPDWRGCLEGALFHDAWYLDMDAMAEATGIPVAKLRRLGDAVFGDLCRALGAPSVVARIYYSAVRALGGLFHGHLGAVVLAASIAALVAGCSGGCAIPDILDGPVPAPIFEKGP